jgi:glycosyltransferase involved in cell wall biosynthesis
MTSPWLSILVPVYGVADYLDACIASILEQEEDGVEVIFVDDASRDGEDAILAAWQARYPDRMRVITHPANRGIAATRNTLLEHGRGEYLWFVDSDDLMVPGSIRALRGLLAKQRPDMVLCDFRIIREFSADAGEPATGQPDARNRKRARDAHVRSFDGLGNVVSGSRDHLLRGLFSRGHMHPWSKIVRRAAWPADLRFVENRVFEDLALMSRLALSMRSFFYVPEVWITYRQRSGSILNSPSAKKLDDWLFALAGYGPQLRNSNAGIRWTTMFIVAHFCTREWRNCVRAFHRLPQSSESRQTLTKFRDYWMASSPLGVFELTWAYLKRGQFRRCLQMHALLYASRP